MAVDAPHILASQVGGNYPWSNTYLSIVEPYRETTFSVKNEVEELTTILNISSIIQKAYANE